MTVYVSLGSNKMPNLVKESKENARKRLEAMDLNLNILFLEEASQDIDKDKVIRTEPSADATLSKGQTVTVYVSTGDDRIKVPDVRGKSLDTAMTLLKNAGFDTNNIKVKESYDSSVSEVYHRAEHQGRQDGRQGQRDRDHGLHRAAHHAADHPAYDTARHDRADGRADAVAHGAASNRAHRQGAERLFTTFGTMRA